MALSAKELAELNGHALSASELAELNGTGSAPSPTAQGSAKDVAAGQISEPDSDPLPVMKGIPGAGFVPDQSVPASSVPQEPTKDELSTRYRAAAGVMSYGAADDAVGMGHAITGKGSGGFWDRFKQGRQGYRDETNRLSEKNPEDAKAGKYIGALMQPGLGGLVKSAAARVGVGAAEGMIAGGLGSEATSGHDLVRDAAVGFGAGVISAVPAASVLSKPTLTKTAAKPFREQVMSALDIGKSPQLPAKAFLAAKDYLAAIGLAARQGQPTAKLVADALSSGIAEKEIRLALTPKGTKQ